MGTRWTTKRAMGETKMSVASTQPMAEIGNNLQDLRAESLRVVAPAIGLAGYVWLIRYPVTDGEPPPVHPGQR